MQEISATMDRENAQPASNKVFLFRQYLPQNRIEWCGQQGPDRTHAVSQRGCDWCLSEIDDAQTCRNACLAVGHQDPLRKIRRVCQPQYCNGVCGRYCVQNGMHDKCLVGVAHDFFHAVVKEANIYILYDIGTRNFQQEIRRKHRRNV